MLKSVNMHHFIRLSAGHCVITSGSRGRNTHIFKIKQTKQQLTFFFLVGLHPFSSTRPPRPPRPPTSRPGGLPCWTLDLWICCWLKLWLFFQNILQWFRECCYKMHVFVSYETQILITLTNVTIKNIYEPDLTYDSHN